MLLSPAHKVLFNRPQGGIDAYTQALIHCDGVDGATGFVDSSIYGRSVSVTGNAQVDTAQFKFGGASYLGDGNTDSLVIADAAALRPGSGDFTVDMWLRFAVGSAFHTLMDKGGNSAGNFLIQTDNLTTPSVYAYVGGVSADIISSVTWALNTWFHFALVRSGTSLVMYKNGIGVGSFTNSSNLNGTAQINFGVQNGSPTVAMNGWLDEIRYSVGVARWTAPFTPPERPYS